MRKEKTHRRDAKNAEKFFIKKIKYFTFFASLENELNNWMMKIIIAIENTVNYKGFHVPDELPEQIQSVRAR
jgi:hypothetical protein